jgi:hypothetical protein
MDHAEVRELLELAAAEPGGVDALLRRDSDDSQPIRDHLAGCAECQAELAELRESVATIRDVIRTTPAPELRARTLALVASTGRSRDNEPVAAPPTRARFAWASLLPAVSLGAVAVAMIAIVLVWRTVDTRMTVADARIEEQQSAMAALTAVTDWTLQLGTAPDAQLVRLGSPSNADRVGGTVLFSADRGELLMIARGLPVPPAGYQYRCWIDQGDGPMRIGRLYGSGAMSYWAGDVDRLRGIEGPFSIGVSLVTDSGAAAGEPVLVGSQ